MDAPTPPPGDRKQGRCRLLTFRGDTQPLTHWARQLGIPATTIVARLDRLHWSVDRALSTPAQVNPLPRPAAARVPRLNHHRPSGRARVRIGGRDHYLGAWGSPEAAAAYARLVEEVARGASPALTALPPSPTLIQLLAAFWEHAQTYYVKRGKPTAEVYSFRAVVDLLLRLPLARGLLARDFTPAHLQEVRAQFLQARQPRTGRPWTRGHINEQVNRVRRVFSWGVAQGVVPIATLQALQEVAGLRRTKTTAPEGKKVVPVAWAVVEQTLPHLPANLQALVRIHWLLGCRAEEVCPLRACDLDRAADPVHGCWRYDPPTYKTEHLDAPDVTHYWLGPQAQAILAPLLAAAPAPDAYLFGRPPGHSRGRGLLSPCWTRGTYYCTIQRACQRHGITPWSPRQLRHSRGTEVKAHEYRQGREGREGAQAVLGHRTPTTTDIYAEQDALAQRIQQEIG